MEVCLDGLHSKRRCPPLGIRSPLGSAVMALRSIIVGVVQLRQEDRQRLFVKYFTTPVRKPEEKKHSGLCLEAKDITTINMKSESGGSGGHDYRCWTMKDLRR